MLKVNKLDVLYNHQKVGTLATTEQKLVAFEYDDRWLIDGFSISPFSLPLEKKVFIPKIDPFNGVFGVFSDSLPDGWGRLLVDRYLSKHNVNPFTMGNLNRLAIVGDSGMGGLTYVPSTTFPTPTPSIDLDEMAMECSCLLKTEHSDQLDDLFLLGGSSGGARPKLLMNIDGEEWIIKFPSSHDSVDIGAQEYQYSLCAKSCGIKMSETRLFPSKICSGYFGTKRFDRILSSDNTIKRCHMVSVSGLLETSHRIPNLDYNILMKLTLQLTNDYSQIESLFKRMCFNVFAHNRDDHSKNFTYLYNDTLDTWQLSPAYDLTYSYSLQGEHATTINGNGSNPNTKDLLAVANKIGMRSNLAKEIATNVKDCVDSYTLF